MMKSSKTVRRENLRGATVVMSDGWHGKVEQDAGGLVVCIADGEVPDIHWCGDYRILSRWASSIRMDGDKAIVRWARTIPTRPAAEREKLLREFHIEEARAQLDQEWQAAPLH